MSLAAFPTLTGSFDIPDSSTFSEMAEDPALKTKMEGGYMVSRRKHTRAPRKTFTFTYRELSAANKATLVAFWTTVGGGSDMFTWVNPQDDATYTVRFSKPPTFRYIGAMNTERWEVTYEVEQV